MTAVALATPPQPTVTGKGEVRAICAVTGVPDQVGDVIVPGAFRRTLTRTRPKIVHDHDWRRPIGRVCEAIELMPGDSRLPALTADGDPWPAEAGALRVDGLLNLATDDGRRAYSQIKFDGDQAWSIGYQTRKAQRRNGYRFIHDLDLFEVGPTLVGAHRWARTLEVKSFHGIGDSDGTPGESCAEVVARARAWRADAWGVLRPVCSVCGSEDRIEDVPGPDGNRRELCRWCRVAVRAIGRQGAGVR